MAGTIAAAVVNWGFRAPKEPAKASDFFTRVQKKPPRRTKANGQAVSNQIRSWVDGLKARGLVVEAKPNG